MLTREIVCSYCGKAGEIGIWGLHKDIVSSVMFEYQGFNPFSGHMHFKCPVCKRIFLARPMAALDHDPITTEHYPSVASGERLSGFISALRAVRTKLVQKRAAWQNPMS